jgi:hypothetical protein
LASHFLDIKVYRINLAPRSRAPHSTGTPEHRSVERRNTVTNGVTATQDSICEWREEEALVTAVRGGFEVHPRRCVGERCFARLRPNRWLPRILRQQSPLYHLYAASDVPLVRRITGAA